MLALRRKGDFTITPLMIGLIVAAIMIVIVIVILSRQDGDGFISGLFGLLGLK